MYCLYLLTEFAMCSLTTCILSKSAIRQVEGTKGYGRLATAYFHLLIPHWIYQLDFIINSVADLKGQAKRDSYTSHLVYP